MPRLLQINVTAAGGSTGTLVENLARTATARDWECWTLYGRGTPNPVSHCVRIGNRADQIGHSLAARFCDCHGRLSAHATRAALARIPRPDLIHLHVLHGYYANYPAIFQYATRHRIPLVWTLHDCWSFTGRCTHFDFLGCQRWQSGCGHCPSKGVYPRSLLDGTAAAWHAKQVAYAHCPCLTLVPVSHWLASLLPHSLLAGLPIRTIPNGVDTSLFHPADRTAAKAEFGWQGRRVLLAAAMNWGPRKGLDDYLALSARLPDDCLLVLVGMDAKKLAMAFPEAPGLTRFDRCFYFLHGRLGALPRLPLDRLARCYQAADLVLNLSYEESFGLTTAEALATDLPVIAYDRTASPELLTPETGRICHAGDLAAVLDAIRDLLDTPPTTAVCRQTALDRFSLARQMDAYLQLYAEATRS